MALSSKSSGNEASSLRESICNPVSPFETIRSLLTSRGKSSNSSIKLNNESSISSYFAYINATKDDLRSRPSSSSVPLNTPFAFSSLIQENTPRTLSSNRLNVYTGSLP